MASVSPAVGPSASRPLMDYYKCLAGLLGKSDGRDKFLAAIQFVAMWQAAGQAQPGHAGAIAKNLGGARKPFRVLKPLDVLVGLLHMPPAKGPALLALLEKVKMLGFLGYFLGDHIVWASSIGLVTDKSLAERATKVSMLGWMSASVATLITETAALLKTEASKKDLDGKELSQKRIKHTLLLTQNSCQVAVAGSLLGLFPLKPRQIATCGVVMSCINLYLMSPTLPALPSKAKGA